MRFASPLPTWALALAALVACSSKSSGSRDDAGNEAGDDDASTASCTSIGGTCAPSLAPTCPLLQQNPTLCGNVLLVCCLPAGSDAAIVEPEDAGETPDSGTVTPTPDAGSIVDAGTADAAPHDASIE
jgi:hypothetical protein